jgi:hypothetical protein
MAPALSSLTNLHYLMTKKKDKQTFKSKQKFLRCLKVGMKLQGAAGWCHLECGIRMGLFLACSLKFSYTLCNIQLASAGCFTKAVILEWACT